MNQNESITLQAPAKVNLRLEITGKRDDGYHELYTIFQKISLFDRITLSKTDQKGISISTDSLKIPSDSSNLAYKAADALLKHCNVQCGLSIHIKKKIPSEAGLGGGSSDAAATLTGLNRLLNLQVDEKTMLGLAVRLGADVPLFILETGTAIATGIGEKLSPVPMESPLWFLVVFPGISISTKWAYTTFSKDNLLTNQQKNITLYNSIKDSNEVKSLLYNDFERVILPAYPEIEAIKRELCDEGAVGALLSGSGSSVFGLFQSEGECEKALQSLQKDTGHQVFMARSI